MNIIEAKNKISLVKDKLREMQKIAYVDSCEFEPDPATGYQHYDGSESMTEIHPDLSAQLQVCWEDLQKIVPAGFSIDGNLIRHLSFNQSRDWYDIAKFDVPREMFKIEEYEKQLTLIEYLETLRPEVSRITEIVLNGDIDAALKTVYSSLDVKIRDLIKAQPNESTVPMIGKAFKEGFLNAPHQEHTDCVRNFLQGVVGYYRANIIHQDLPPQRNSVNSSLSLFCLAHETFWLLDACAKQRQENL